MSNASPPCIKRFSHDKNPIRAKIETTIKRIIRKQNKKYRNTNFLIANQNRMKQSKVLILLFGFTLIQTTQPRNFVSILWWKIVYAANLAVEMVSGRVNCCKHRHRTTKSFESFNGFDSIDANWEYRNENKRNKP